MARSRLSIVVERKLVRRFVAFYYALVLMNMAMPPIWADTKTVEVSRDETFRRIAESLNEINSQLRRQVDQDTIKAYGHDKGTSDAIWNASSVFYTTGPITGLLRPDPAADVAATLLPNTRVKILGQADGFVELAPFNEKGIGTPFWVPAGVARTSLLSDAASWGINSAINTLAALASTLRDNPYVRLSGFSVSASIPPSITAEFVLKEEEGLTTAPSGKPVP